MVYVELLMRTFEAILKGYSTTGSKDRLHRAKTIDLCQNPLTVCTPPSLTLTLH